MTKRLVLFGLLACLGLSAQKTVPENRFAAISKASSKLDGFLPLYWDQNTGKIWLAISRMNQELLYITALSAGVGSNDLGLDRGRMNEPRVVAI